jgi:fructose-1,6-bisphosphatase/inositol monophosphatase family enzyme
MKLSEIVPIYKTGEKIIEISRGMINNPQFRQVIEVGGLKEIVARGDVAIEDAVADYLQKFNIPVNLDGEEKRQRKLCKNPLGKVTLDPIDGTNNFVSDTLHYCTIATIFDTPNPKTLGEAVWAGIYDHSTDKEAHFSSNGVMFGDKNIWTGDPRPLTIKSIKDLQQGEPLNIFLDLGPGETSESLKPYDNILEISWRKNVSCAGYHLMEVANGGRDAYICPVQKPEELVAGIPLIKATGGAVLTFDGQDVSKLPYDFDKRYPIVAARTPQLARELVNMIQAA